MKFYFDEHMSRHVAEQLINHGHEVALAVDVGMKQKEDEEHLLVAFEMNAVLVTQDRAFGGLTAKRGDHAGLICWTGTDNDFGGMVRHLLEFANSYTQDKVQGQVFWMK
jgi:predicted nuclease of predicted toxin-antitoxin system